MRFLELGFKHVIPLGYDHILFILCLYFYQPDLKKVIIQCTVFTLAHSITLAMAALNWVNINTTLTETIIAASIFFLAVENIISSQVNPFRNAVIFAFGLFHGLGFASALIQIGLPQDAFLPSLLLFNLGVELAQVSIILLAYFSFGKWFRYKSWYRPKMVYPISAAIACIALYWTITRINP